MDLTLPSGRRLTNAYAQDVPDAQEIEAQGGRILKADVDGTPLIVLWPRTGQISMNRERLSDDEMADAFIALDRTLTDVMKWAKKKKSFWQL